jgi:hypothetical protein
MTKQEALNLDQLGDSYDIIGELAARDDARIFMATRKSDGRDVLVTVARTPERDQGNALSHLAADANLLGSLNHPNLLPIIEGRWLGTDAFALVTDRTKSPTLHELLARRDEEFGFPRIAAILREANGVLEWARERKVVHRAITPQTLFVEPGSDRVCVTFGVSSLLGSGVPGADSDARCIAELARAMFTRSPAAPERAERPLAELRPGLPMLLVDETDNLLRSARPEESSDVTGYIARIAMADALKKGEVHIEETRTAVEEEKRVFKEQLEKERREHEQQLAAERKQHELQVAEQAKQFTKERENFERELAKERKELTKQREALAKERAAHAKDGEALARERESHAKDRALLLEERARHEQTKKEERERLAAEALALQAQAKLHAQAAAQKAVERKQVLADSKRANTEFKRAAAEFKRTVVSPAKAERMTDVGITSKPAGRSRSIGSSLQRPYWNSKWNVPAAAAALVLLIAVTALAIGGGHRNPREPLQLAQGAGSEGRGRSSARIVDSAAGVVARYQSIIPLPEITTDTATLSATATDWTPPPKRRPKPIPPPIPQPVAPPSTSSDESSRFIFQLDSAARRDTAAIRSKTGRVDTLFKRDTLFRPISPSPTRRDSVLKPDTLKRDTTAHKNERRLPSRRR